MDAAEQVATVCAQLLLMLMPYITTMDVPLQLPMSANASWAAPVVCRCTTTLTSHIPLGMLMPQEVQIHVAVKGMVREICQWLALTWLELFDVKGESKAKAAEAIEVGSRCVNKLMTWLEWSLWLRCDPTCGFGICNSTSKFLLPHWTAALFCTGDLSPPIVAIFSRGGSVWPDTVLCVSRQPISFLAQGPQYSTQSLKGHWLISVPRVQKNINSLTLVVCKAILEPSSTYGTSCYDTGDIYHSWILSMQE